MLACATTVYTPSRLPAEVSNYGRPAKHDVEKRFSSFIFGRISETRDGMHSAARTIDLYGDEHRTIYNDTALPSHPTLAATVLRLRSTRKPLVSAVSYVQYESKNNRVDTGHV